MAAKKKNPKPANESSPQVETRKKILIVDNHPLVREWFFKRITDGKDGLVVTASAGSGLEALQSMEAAIPDIVICSLSLPDMFGIELIKDIRARFPGMPVLVVSLHSDSMYAERALRAGALGYVCKQSETDDIITAIYRVLDGEIYLSEPMAAAILKKFAQGTETTLAGEVDGLSDRELEIFQLVGIGKSSKEIADQLHIGFKTVESYKTRLKEKLDLDSSRELLQHAIQWVLAEAAQDEGQNPPGH